MLILGINSFHPDASAALVCDGKLVAAIAEERLNRRKHYAGFPIKAVHECLRLAGADVRDIEHLAIARDPRANRSAKIKYLLSNLPRTVGPAVKQIKNRAKVEAAQAHIARSFGIARSSLKWKVHFVEHHLAHVAGSYLVSDFDSAAGFSIDGSGDFATCMFCRCEGNRIDILDRVLLPHSLGVFYTAICQLIGYDRYGDEGKVMGLAPYGKDVYHDAMVALIRIRERGRYDLDLSYFTHHRQTEEIQIDEKGNIVLPTLYSVKMEELFGGPHRNQAELTQRDMNLAASLQSRFEDVYFHSLNHLHRLYPSGQLSLAGGCALNSVANGKIFDKTPFQTTYIQPAASDDGTALGAAFYVCNCVLGRSRHWTMRDASTGPAWSESEIVAALREAGVPFSRLDQDRLIEQTAEALENGLVVGWFQGRMEWGPRALGCRSILAHPGRSDMKDILNARVKHREWFRPFAPSILIEHVNEHFERQEPSPFMLHVYRIRPEKRDKLCAVNHVDNTGRLQTVAREENALYYDLISAFADRTGIPVLLNTSFNENEPIVCRPQEAVECFLRTRMDVLAIGPFLCRKGADDRGPAQVPTTVSRRSSVV